MKLETKYEIGQKIWIVYSNNGEVCIYDDTIAEIAITTDKKLCYITDTDGVELKEEEIIPYGGTVKLLFKIMETMKKIHEEEKNNE